MNLKTITNALEQLAPISLQESYDNSGLLVGRSAEEIRTALLTLDVTEEVVEEAHRLGCELIIAHHPIIFSGLKRLTGKTHVERTVISAIKHDIAIYAIHTNLDNVQEGVNLEICRRIGIANPQILSPKGGFLRKLIVYVPHSDSEVLKNALFAAGAGAIGNYSECSFATQGSGTFTPNESANPAIGHQGQRESVEESKLEFVFEKWKTDRILKEMKANHPYEEVAHQVIDIVNPLQSIGLGMIGQLSGPMNPNDFLQHLKSSMSAAIVRHTAPCSDVISKVAVCGGSGSFLLPSAIAAGAEAIVTADFTYHKFFDAEGKIMIADIGHYETEQFTPSLLKTLLAEKLPTFATRLSETNTNPVRYF